MINPSMTQFLKKFLMAPPKFLIAKRKIRAFKPMSISCKLLG